MMIDFQFFSAALELGARRIVDIISYARVQVFNAWMARDNRELEDFQERDKIERFQDKLQMLVDEVESANPKLDYLKDDGVSQSIGNHWDISPFFSIANAYADDTSTENHQIQKESSSIHKSESRSSALNASHWTSSLCESIKSHGKGIAFSMAQEETELFEPAIRISYLQEGDLDAAVADLCKTAVIVPVLSWIEQRNGPQPTYSGSLGQLVGLEPRRQDRVDPFLVQIVVANALWALPSQRRMIQSIYPIFSTLEVSGEDCQSLTHSHILQLLSPDPSIETNRKAAELLRKHGIPLASGMLHRSIRENVARLFDVLAFEGLLRRQVHLYAFKTPSKF
jgi:hypothetical protein